MPALITTAMCSTAGGLVIGWWLRYLFVHGLQHRWVEVSRTHVPTQKWADVNMLVTGGEQRRLHLTGFTTVLFQCALCSELRTVQLPGEVHHPKVVPLRRVGGDS